MQALRSSSRLARLVLAWFVLTMGVAIASPVVQPRPMELVCSAGGGIRLVAADADKADLSGKPHTLDCALCLPAPLPTSAVCVAVPAPFAVGPAPLASAVDAPFAAEAGAPLPPRGPPRA